MKTPAQQCTESKYTSACRKHMGSPFRIDTGSANSLVQCKSLIHLRLALLSNRLSHPESALEIVWYMASDNMRAEKCKERGVLFICQLWSNASEFPLVCFQPYLWHYIRIINLPLRRIFMIVNQACDTLILVSNVSECIIRPYQCMNGESFPSLWFWSPTWEQVPKTDYIGSISLWADRI